MSWSLRREHGSRRTDEHRDRRSGCGFGRGLKRSDGGAASTLTRPVAHLAPRASSCNKSCKTSIWRLRVRAPADGAGARVLNAGSVSRLAILAPCVCAASRSPRCSSCSLWRAGAGRRAGVRPVRGRPAVHRPARRQRAAAAKKHLERLLELVGSIVGVALLSAASSSGTASPSSTGSTARAAPSSTAGDDEHGPRRRARSRTRGFDLVARRSRSALALRRCRHRAAPSYLRRR